MKKSYTLAEATKATGFSRNRLEEIVEKAGQKIDSGVPEDVVDDILQEQSKYISFREFAATPRGEKYDGATSSKNKLLDELELNSFFGVELIEPDDLLIGKLSDIVFFKRSDIPVLENHLCQFFGLYALSEADKVERLLETATQVNTKVCLRKYMEYYILGESMKPVFTEFVTLLLTLPDLPKIEGKHIMHLLSTPMSVSAKNTLINFLNYARHHFPKVRYNRLSQKIKKANLSRRIPMKLTFLLLHISSMRNISTNIR